MNTFFWGATEFGRYLHHRC